MAYRGVQEYLEAMPQEAEVQPIAELKQAGETSFTALCYAPARSKRTPGAAC